jgi:hypothetical protein
MKEVFSLIDNLFIYVFVFLDGNFLEGGRKEIVIFCLSLVMFVLKVDGIKLEDMGM